MPAPPPRPSGPRSSPSTSASSAARTTTSSCSGASSPTAAPRIRSVSRCTSPTARCSARRTRTRRAALPVPGRRCAGRWPGLAEHLATWPGTAALSRVHPAAERVPAAVGLEPRVRAGHLAPPAVRHRARRARAAPEPARLRAAADRPGRRRVQRPRFRRVRRVAQLERSGRRPSRPTPLIRPRLPRVFITGASGFAGAYLVAACEAAGDVVVPAPPSSAPTCATRRSRARSSPTRGRTSSTTSPRAPTSGESWAGPARHARRQRRDDRERARGGAPRGARGGGRRRSARARSTGRPRRVPDDRGRAAAPAEPVRGLQGVGRARRALLRRRVRAARDPRPRVQPLRPRPGADLRHRELRDADRARPRRRRAIRSAIVTGNLDTRRDFTDVRDIVRAYRLLAERGEPGVYNVCSGVSRSARELIAALGEVAGVPVEHRGRPSQAPRPRGAWRSAAPPTACTPPPAGSPRSRSSRPSPTRITLVHELQRGTVPLGEAVEGGAELLGEDAGAVDLAGGEGLRADAVDLEQRRAGRRRR